MKGKFGRFAILTCLMTGLLLALLLVAGRSVLARTSATQLTIGKTTRPSGGQDFLISAIGYQNALVSGLKSPRDIEQDQYGRYYVVGYISGRVEVLKPDGERLRSWGKKGDAPGEVAGPQDISLLEDGGDVLIYMADSYNDRIQVFTDRGQYLDSWGSLGSGEGQLRRPEGILVAPDKQTVYVADTYNNRIQVFTTDGQFLRGWGSLGSGDGQFRYPTSVALGSNGLLYVVDSNNQRIQVFTTEGDFMFAWGSQGTAPGEFNYPTQVVGGANEFIYVSDTYNNRVQKFTADGRFVTMWGEAGTGLGQFERPKGLLPNAADGLTYVADIDNNRLEAYAEQTVALDDGEQQSLDLPAGVYDVTESPGPGTWTLAAATCDNGQPVAIPGGVSVTLTDGLSTTCTFDNVNQTAPGYSAYLGYIAR